jgi:hypothetical protein
VIFIIWIIGKSISIEGKQMSNLLNQGWYALEFAWSRARDEISGHLVMSVMLVAILILIWNFLSPQVRKKGS